MKLKTLTIALLMLSPMVMAQEDLGIPEDITELHESVEETVEHVEAVVPAASVGMEVEVTQTQQMDEVEVLPMRPQHIEPLKELENVQEEIALQTSNQEQEIESKPTATASNDIPSVPSNVLTNNVPRPVSEAAVAKNTKKSTNRQSQNNQHNYSVVGEGNVIFVEFGINQIVPVAQNHLNRFVTPFSEPVVVTGSKADYEIKENVIYVGTDDNKPVTMFITERGSQSAAISLTLVPQQIPPREINLRFPAGGSGHSGGAGFAYGGSKRAEAWETSMPYVETIKELFKALALNELPQGYQIVRTPSNLQTPSCAMPGLSFDFKNGQYLAGRNLSVFVGVITNVSSNPIEFKESVCGGWDVAAVAAFPRNVLQRGEKTEVYVAVKQQSRSAPKAKRPSLVD